jgi:antibiotic biosynthesis monooxygenase (ABM) superfamily enzyme
MRPVRLHKYRIVLEPDGEVAGWWESLEALAHRMGRPRPVWPDQGVFVPDGIRPPPASNKTYSVSFASGPSLWLSDDLAPGNHAQHDKRLHAVAQKFYPTVQGYDATPHRGEIFQDLQKTDPNDSASVVAFVNRWGVLGIGIPALQAARLPCTFDGVAATVAWIDARRRWIEALLSLQRRKPVTVEASGLTLSPAVKAHYHGRLITWPILAQCLNTLVGSLPLTAYVPQGRARLLPRYWFNSLADLLNAELWEFATGDGYKLRRCQGPGCRIVFRPQHANNKKYCSRPCASKAGVYAFRKQAAKRVR